MNNFWLRKKDCPNLILAPMAGYTDSAFRLLCREAGADIVMTELVSADAIYHNKKLSVDYRSRPRAENFSLRSKNINGLLDSDKTLSLMKFDERERPLVIQLFGKYPEKFAYAAKWVTENLKLDGAAQNNGLCPVAGIDINMGCPARKVVGSDHGAALLKNHNLAIEIVSAVREQIDIPLSVKTRLGWDNDDEILEFAPKLVEAGIDAIIIHGRTYQDGFRNIARWGNIYNVKAQMSNVKNKVAVVGNGDIKSYQDAIDKSESNGVKLDGVAIGRAAFGKPWVFSEKLIVNSKKLKEIIINHAKLAYKTKGDYGIIEFRKHLLAYTKGLQNARELRKKTVLIESVKDVMDIVSQISDNSKCKSQKSK